MPCRNKGSASIEERTRVICHLPLNNLSEEKAVLQVLGYLKEQRKDEIGVKGFTHTEFRPSSFRGYWWNGKRQKWVEDNLVLCIIDYKLGFSDARLSSTVQQLKDTVRTAYRESGSPQDEVWVVAEQVLRHD
jgi:hypothetical protein